MKLAVNRHGAERISAAPIPGLNKDPDILSVPNSLPPFTLITASIISFIVPDGKSGVFVAGFKSSSVPGLAYYISLEVV